MLWEGALPTHRRKVHTDGRGQTFVTMKVAGAFDGPKNVLRARLARQKDSDFFDASGAAKAMPKQIFHRSVYSRLQLIVCLIRRRVL
jgi:hypothetical protein